MRFFVDPPFWMTVTVFILLLGAGIAAALRLRRSEHPRPRVNTPDAGLVGRPRVARPMLIDAFVPQVEAWVQQSEGKIRADVVHD